MQAGIGIGLPEYSGRLNDSVPANIVTVQKFRKSTLATAGRVRLKENARNYIIVRNLSGSNVAQVAFTTVNNNDNNPPTTGFTDINPNEEWYETGSTNQVWFRPKVDTAEVLVEVETSVPTF